MAQAIGARDHAVTLALTHVLAVGSANFEHDGQADGDSEIPMRRASGQKAGEEGKYEGSPDIFGSAYEEPSQ